jgi:6-phospho-beta-glucosidase
MKLTVIGGGGVRSMFLAKSLAARSQELDIQEIVFMDNDAAKLALYGGMAAEVARMIRPDLRFILASDPAEAVKDADYVITTIRAGGDMMRVHDERIALNLGVLGQETTGAAGFSFAMRSAPALLEYCALIRKLAKPGVKVFNFTNPAGVVSQVLRDAGYDFTFGICDAPSGMLRDFAKLYGADPDAVEGECYGLNHLSFFRNITINGKNVVPELLESPEARTATDLKFFEKELLNLIKEIPNEYLYYYYYREKAVKNILAAGKTRGEIIAEINEKMTQELRTVNGGFYDKLAVFEKWYGLREAMYMANETGLRRGGAPWRFDVFSRDDGGYAGVALKYIRLERQEGSGNMILCTPNRGALDFLEDSDVIEATCTVGKSGAVPHRFDGIAPDKKQLISSVKLYERYAAKAILNKDKVAAIRALTVHPLVNSYSLAAELAEQYIRLNRQFTGEWK